ncbi:hypothetical protein BG015_009315 [Linnemannia schmuckeri]|uniref:Uncharacterized protein n=1 Tax=Linnemannia schmuckeri TaxID=64567 RepID=A0A9P5RVM7_9FUNG|nr:hypothetical protein BG015_009315 [Linnemannia schmuckeri]
MLGGAGLVNKSSRSIPPLDLLRPIRTQTPHVSKIIASTSALNALAWNVQHGRKLALEVNEFAYCYSCVFAFQETTSLITNSPAARPAWMPLPDIHTYQLVTLPLMIRLSQLTVSSNILRRCPYKMPSAHDY